MITEFLNVKYNEEQMTENDIKELENYCSILASMLDAKLHTMGYSVVNNNSQKIVSR